MAKGSRSRGWPRTTKANVYCLSRWRGLKKGNVGGLASPIVTRMGSCVLRGEFLNLVVSVLEPRRRKKERATDGVADDDAVDDDDCDRE